MPCNPSVSLTLEKAKTTTRLEWKRLDCENCQVEVVTDDGVTGKKFQAKVEKFLNSMLTSELPWLKGHHFRLHTSNTFPHSAGIASSASGFGAIGLCLASLEQLQSGESGQTPEFFARASHFARLGSGSASRSIYPGVVQWGESQEVGLGSQTVANPLVQANHWSYQLCDAILIIDSGEKAVSSTVGHGLMENHPFAQARFQAARKNFKELHNSLLEANWESMGNIIEAEALMLHALMMTSEKNFLLLKPNTLTAIEKIRSFREKTKTQLYFTLDAGPNIHLLYLEQDRDTVFSFIREEVAGLCEGGQWLDDRVGQGPKLVEVGHAGL